MYIHVLFDDHYLERKRVGPGHVTCGQGVQPNSLSVIFDPTHDKTKIGRVWPDVYSLSFRNSPFPLFCVHMGKYVELCGQYF